MQKLGKIPTNPSTTKGKGKGFIFGTGAVIVLVAAALLSSQNGFNFKSSKPAATAENTSDHDLVYYEAFAQKVCIALNNISYVNLLPDANNDIPYFKTLDPYFDQATQFKVHNGFMDTEHQQKVMALKLFCTAENINIVSAENGSAGVTVWITGTNQYASAAHMTTANWPFSIKLVVLKSGTDYKVTDFILQQSKS